MLALIMVLVRASPRRACSCFVMDGRARHSELLLLLFSTHTIIIFIKPVIMPDCKQFNHAVVATACVTQP